MHFEVLSLESQGTAVLKQTLPLVGTRHDFPLANGCAVGVLLPARDLQSTLVAADHFRLGTGHSDVLVYFIKGQTSSTKQEARDLPKVTQLRGVPLVVLPQNTAAEGVVGAGDQSVGALLQMLLNIAFAHDLAALLVGACDGELHH